MKNKLFSILFAMLVLSAVVLGISTVPVRASSVTYYVATNGSDANPGTTTQPFLTIQKAADVVNPGDTVIIRSGLYTVASGAFPPPISADPAIYISRSGSAEGGYIVFKSEVPGGARIVSTGGYDVILINANYIEIDGLDVSGTVGGHCIESENSHHTRILNSRLHDCGGAGIGANYGDYYHFEGNVTYNNANINPFATSGISIYQARPISDNAPGFHNIIRNNISYNNIELDTGTHTDGNGIIIDDFQNTQNESTAGIYPYQTLVENNVTFYNGGKGIVVYLSNNVVVRNNTVFWNNRDNENDSTWRGEINISMSSNITVVNNIAWSNPAYNGFNTAIVDAAYDGYSNDSNIWQNNLLFNGTAGNNSIRVDINGETSSDSAIRLNQILATSASNRLGVDPMFINPSVSGLVNFRLQSSSPAIDAGTSDFELSSVDLDGNARVNGRAVDLGSYEFGGAAVPTATALAYTATPLPAATPTPTATFTVPDNSTLSAELCANTGTIDLTSEGTHDWAHWGRSDWGTSGVFDHKANVTQQISVGLPNGYAPVNTRRASEYEENASVFTWSDGTPSTSAAGLDTGLYISTVGEGFRITARADATHRTFRVYMGVWGAQARVTATLNTRSYSDTSIINTTDSTLGCYIFSYTGHTGTTDPQFLTVDIVVEANYLDGGNVTLQAATLYEAVEPPNLSSE